MKIIFHQLQIRNFLSFGQKTQTLLFDHQGICFITGTNYDIEDCQNGCGKSTIIDAISYALYGQPLRDITKDVLSNQYTQQPAEVALEFFIQYNNQQQTHYRIYRCNNPSICKIFKDKQNITPSTIQQSNAFIAKLIKTPFTVFKHSIAQSINASLPFMALPKTDKRKYIETVFGLEIFSDMLAYVRNDWLATKQTYDIELEKQKMFEQQLSIQENTLKSYEVDIRQRKEFIDTKIKTFHHEIEQLKNELANLYQNKHYRYLKKPTYLQQIIPQRIECYQFSIQKIQKKIHALQTEIRLVSKQKTQIQNQRTHCTLCKRPFDEDHQKHIDQLIQEKQQHIDLIQNNIIQLERILTCKEKRLKILKTKIRNIQSLLQQIKNIDKEIEHKKQFILEFEAQKKELANPLEIYKQNQTIYQDLKQKHKQNQNLLRELNDKLNVINLVKFLVSEEGIKSYLIKQVLDVFCIRVNFYLKQLQMNCLCSFNESLEEQFFDELKQPRNYFSFSAGERKRIDVACMFALSDIRHMFNNTSFSIIFYDELFDSSIDQKGMESILQLLQERWLKYQESSYIITHRAHFVAQFPYPVIRVDKKEMFSYLSLTKP